MQDPILAGVLEAEPEKNTYAQVIYLGDELKVLEWENGETEGGKQNQDKNVVMNWMSPSNSYVEASNAAVCGDRASK